ncbi:MAG: glycosyltransferase [Candidatus Eremiobacteraeota bacterium]|nr:glycosyltransferase [Candidatus Eremiobacteraeota bacterium]
MRPDASTRFGGDTVLARDNFTALKELGVDADFVETDRPDARGYDIAHIFNVGQPEVCQRQMDACQEAGVPIALSPVWLDLREYFGRAHAYEHLFLHAKQVQTLEPKLRRLREEKHLDSFLDARQRSDLERRLAQQTALLRRARVLLPNSAIEARDCLVQLGVREIPLVTVLIAANLEPARFWQEEKSGLMCIGRVETRKNQSGLCYALRNDDNVELNIVGASFNPGLVQVCLKLCPSARFHGKVPRQPMLEMLGRSEVHALVSWCETAGIATLEAAAAGAKIVVGDRGAEVEYFGSDAEYADPADSDSIRAAVMRAFARPPRYRGDPLDQRIRRFTWRESAQETLRGYNLALGSSAELQHPVL